MVSQTCFHCKTYCASLSVPLVTQHRKRKETITMQILAHFGMCLQLVFITLMNFKNFKNVVLGSNVT